MRAMLLLSAGLLSLATAYWFKADALQKSKLAGGVGADGFPKMLAILLAVLAVALALQSLSEHRQKQRATSLSTSAPATPPMEWRQHLRALGLIALGAAYILVLPYLGYAVAVALLLGAVATYAGLRPSRITAFFAIGGGAMFYLIFVRLLGIPLPSGIWPALLH